MRIDNPGPPVTPPGSNQSGAPTENVGKNHFKNQLENETEPRVPGVIRHLQEGHFKGVADVRLRINFQDQLQGIASASQSAAIEAAGPTVVSAVEEAVGSLLESAELTDEQKTEVQTLFGTFTENVRQIPLDNSEEVLQQFNSVFGEFSTALRELLGLGIESVIPEETTESGDTSVEELVTAIESAFGEAISTLQQAISDAASILRHLSPPNGNGAAYQRFVDILQGLNEEAPVESGDTAPDTNSIDENI